MTTEYKKLLDNFRLSIRRRQVDQLFQSQRTSLLKQQTERNREELRLKLGSVEAREQWLHEEALKLTGFVQAGWLAVFRRIYLVLTMFQGEFQGWIGMGVCGAVCEVIKGDWAKEGELEIQGELPRLAANMLSDIFYLCSKNNDHKVIKAILQLKFVDSLIPLAIRNPATEYIRLLGITCEVAPTLRNYFISIGLLDFVLLKIGKLEEKAEVDRSSENFRALLYLVYALLKTHQLDKQTFVKPKKSTILALLPVLASELCQNSVSPNLCLLLRSLKQLCLVQKPQIFTSLTSHPQIFTKALQILSYETRSELRLASIRFLANFLLSEDPLHTRFLVNLGVLDRVYEAYLVPGNRDQNVLGIVSFLGNFTADCWEFQELVVGHRLMEVIVHEASSSHSQQIRQQSVYCICNILRKLWSPSCPMPPTTRLSILTALSLPQTLLSNLSRNDRNYETVREILTTFRDVLMEEDQEKYRGEEEGRVMYRMLVGRYGIKELLEGIEEFDEIEGEIWEFVGFLQQMETY